MATEGGQPGNDNAARGKEFRAAIQRALAKRSSGAGWRVALDKIATKLIELAEDGEQWAVQEVANRMDGKPAQTTVLTGDEEGGPVKIQSIEIKAVDP